MKTHCLALLFVLTGCSRIGVLPTKQPIAPGAIAPRPAATASSPTRIPTLAPTATPIPRWVEYQTALANALHPKEAGVLCEWDTLGQQGREVYVWAMCYTEWSAGSAPAVVQLGTDGRIEKVTLPRDGSYYSQDIRVLFPPLVLRKVMAHEFPGAVGPYSRTRIAEPSLPPFSVASGTPLP